MDLLTEPLLPIEQEPFPQTVLFVRSSLPQAGVALAIRQTIAAVNSNQAIYLITPMDVLLADSVSARRFNLLLLGGFSALALMLAQQGLCLLHGYCRIHRWLAREPRAASREHEACDRSQR